MPSISSTTVFALWKPLQPSASLLHRLRSLFSCPFFLYHHGRSRKVFWVYPSRSSVCAGIVRFPESCSPSAEIWTQGGYEWACGAGWAPFKLDAKVLRLFKTLKQNESRAVAKVRCVASELSNDNNGTGDEENSSDPSNLDSLLESMSSSFFIDPGPLSQTVVASSHSWVGSLWAPMCFLRYCILFTWRDSGFSANHPLF
jgi:hypothetical protein